jgi:hypothetical protein
MSDGTSHRLRAETTHGDAGCDRGEEHAATAQQRKGHRQDARRSTHQPPVVSRAGRKGPASLSDDPQLSGGGVHGVGGGEVDLNHCLQGQQQPVGFQNSATGADLRFQAARSYSLISPPRTGRRLIGWRSRRWAG